MSSQSGMWVHWVAGFSSKVKASLQCRVTWQWATVAKWQLKSETIHRILAAPPIFKLNSAKKQKIHFLNVNVLKKLPQRKIDSEKGVVDTGNEQIQFKQMTFKNGIFFDLQCCTWLWSREAGVGCIISKFKRILFSSLRITWYTNILMLKNWCLKGSSTWVILG